MEELSAKEKVEQQELRKEYLEAFRGGMRHHIEGMKVVDQEGTDVTLKTKKFSVKRTSQQKVIAFIVEISYTMNKGKT